MSYCIAGVYNVTLMLESWIRDVYAAVAALGHTSIDPTFESAPGKVRLVRVSTMAGKVQPYSFLHFGVAFPLVPIFSVKA
jgi:hypothetical protein